MQSKQTCSIICYVTEIGERLFPLDKPIKYVANMYAFTRGAIYNLHFESTNQPTDRKNLAIQLSTGKLIRCGDPF